MLWVNKNLDKINLLHINSDKQLILINENDINFKYWLDRYKYFERFPENTKDYYFEKSSFFLTKIEKLLKYNTYIINDKIQLIDLAIIPFIRQFANVDFDLFKSKFYNITNWYIKIIDSDRFKNIMNKYEFWSNNDQPLIINLYQKNYEYKNNKK